MSDFENKKKIEWILEKIGSKGRSLTTVNGKKRSFIGHILRSKDINCDLFMEAVYGKRGRGGQRQDTAITSRKSLVAELLWNSPDWHIME